MEKCLVCGTHLSKHRFVGLLECEKCGFITADVTLKEDEIKRLYSEGYYNGEEYEDYLRDEAILCKQFNNRLDTIQKYKKNIDSVLELGCAYGFFLREASKRFKHVKGIDVAEAAVNYASNVLNMEAYVGDYYTEFPEESFDLVCMWDTIEHLQYPELYLDKISRNQKAGDMLCVTTGDIGSFLARIQGRKWRQIHPPTHLQYFSLKTLTKFLEKYNYKIVHQEYIPTEVCINTILYTYLCLRSNHKKIFDVLSKMPFTKMSIKVKLFDYMFLVAEKVED